MYKTSKTLLNLRDVIKGDVISPISNPLLIIPSIIKDNGITEFQGNVITACSKIASHFGNTFIFVTSTNVTYRGMPRTESNGANHLSNEAIDIIFTSQGKDKAILTDPAFNYARSLLIWKIAYAIAKGLGNVCVCIEDDHLHFHKSTGVRITLQSIVGKQKEAFNPNANFFCDGAHAKVQDITAICSNLFNK